MGVAGAGREGEMVREVGSQQGGCPELEEALAEDRWHKNEKHLQSLHTGERVFGEGVLFVFHNLINMCLNTHTHAVSHNSTLRCIWLP